MDQLIGVFDAQWMRPMANVLSELGSESAWITHSHNGMDEIMPGSDNASSVLEDGALVTIGPNDIVRMEKSIITSMTFTAIPKITLDELRGSDAVYNAEAVRQLFCGKIDAYRFTVLINAAAALCVAGAVKEIPAGVARAAQAIDSGAAQETLEKLVRLTAQKP